MKEKIRKWSLYVGIALSTLSIAGFVVGSVASAVIGEVRIGDNIITPNAQICLCPGCCFGIAPLLLAAILSIKGKSRTPADVEIEDEIAEDEPEDEPEAPEEPGELDEEELQRMLDELEVEPVEEEPPALPEPEAAPTAPEAPNPIPMGLTDIDGIGPKTADIFHDNGVGLYELAILKTAFVQSVFDESDRRRSKVREWQAQARQLLGITQG